RHFPAFRAAALDSLRFAHAGRKFSCRFPFRKPPIANRRSCRERRTLCAKRTGSSPATAAQGDAIRDSDSRVWPPPSSRSVEKSSASYDRIETRALAGRAGVQPRRHPPLDNANQWRIAGRYQPMFAFFSNRLGCLGSIVVSVVGTLILLAILRGCH